MQQASRLRRRDYSSSFDLSAKDGLQKFFDYGNTAITKVVEIVMGFAPIGVLCLMADVTGTLGNEVLRGLGKMLAMQYIAYATIIVVILPLILKFVAKVNSLQHYMLLFCDNVTL